MKELYRGVRWDSNRGVWYGGTYKIPHLRTAGAVGLCAGVLLIVLGVLWRGYGMRTG